MRKVIVFLSAVLLISNTPLFAQNFRGKSEKVVIAPPLKALAVGEKLVYSVEWLGVPIGKIILNIEESKGPKGEELYHFTGRSFPNKFFTRFYDIEYKWDSYVYKDTLEPFRLNKLRRINDDYLNVDVKFDRKTHTAEYKHIARGQSEEVVDFPSGRLIKVSNKNSLVSYPEDTRDLLAMVYFFRLMDLKYGNNYTVHVFYGELPWEVQVRLGKPYMKDIYRKGSLPVFVMNTDTDLVYYILGKRSIKIEFTADSRRIPILVVFNTTMGQFRAVIQNLPL